MKRKKRLIFLILSLCFFRLFASTSIVTPFQMRGHVFGTTTFSVSILSSAIPFDLEGSNVAENINYTTTLGGLQIGAYTLKSNTTTFALYVAHDALVLTDRSYGAEGDPGTLSSINYRLYMETANGGFKSCLSDDGLGQTTWSAKNASIKMVLSGTDSTDWPANTTELSNKKMYISLEDRTSGTTADTVADLMAGTYSSTIYFLLEGGT